MIVIYWRYQVFCIAYNRWCYTRLRQHRLRHVVMCCPTVCRRLGQRWVTAGFPLRYNLLGPLSSPRLIFERLSGSV